MSKSVEYQNEFPNLNAVYSYKVVVNLLSLLLLLLLLSVVLTNISLVGSCEMQPPQKSCMNINASYISNIIILFPTCGVRIRVYFAHGFDAQNVTSRRQFFNVSNAVYGRDTY